MLPTPMTRPQAIVFDMDDTLILRPGRAQEAWHGAIAEIPELTERHSRDAVLGILDKARERAWNDPKRRQGPALDYAGARRALIQETLEHLGCAAQGVAERFEDCVARYQGRSSHLNEGAMEVLAALRSKGIPLALLTNGESRTQRGKIERFALAAYFEHILIEEEIGAGKPFEAAYRTALSRFSCPSCDVWMIGDHLVNDVAGAKKHGMRTIWYNPERAALPDDPAQRPDGAIVTLSEIVDLAAA
jgi:putative hydrolase of the HAD superfamily